VLLEIFPSFSELVDRYGGPQGACDKNRVLKLIEIVYTVWGLFTAFFSPSPSLSVFPGTVSRVR